MGKVRGVIQLPVFKKSIVNFAASKCENHWTRSSGNFTEIQVVCQLKVGQDWKLPYWVIFETQCIKLYFYFCMKERNGRLFIVQYFPWAISVLFAWGKDPGMQRVSQLLWHVLLQLGKHAVIESQGHRPPKPLSVPSFQSLPGRYLQPLTELFSACPFQLPKLNCLFISNFWLSGECLAMWIRAFHR